MSKNYSSEDFRGSLLPLFFFRLCPMEMIHITKAFLRPEGSCSFQCFSPGERIFGFFSFINRFFFADLFHSFPKASSVYRFIFWLSIEFLYQTWAKQPFLTSKKARNPHHSRKNALVPTTVQKIFIPLDSPISVSYTHLDVYKRQDIDRAVV